MHSRQNTTISHQSHSALLNQRILCEFTVKIPISSFPWLGFRWEGGVEGGCLTKLDSQVFADNFILFYVWKILCNQADFDNQEFTTGESGPKNP